MRAWFLASTCRSAPRLYSKSSRSHETDSAYDPCMGRVLTDRERDLLTFMVNYAMPFADSPSVSASARERWSRLIPTTRAGHSCDCGACPSIELEDEGVQSPNNQERIVLSASHPKASLLLFIDGDRFSYLELAPYGDDVFEQFPTASEVTL